MTDIPDSAGDSRIGDCSSCGDGSLDQFKVSSAFDVFTKTC